MAGNRRRNPPPSWSDIILYSSLAVGAYLGYTLLLAPKPAPVESPTDGDGGEKKTEPLGKYKVEVTYQQFKSWYSGMSMTVDFTQEARAIAAFTGFTEVMAFEVLQWWKGFEAVGRYPYETEWQAELRAVGTRYGWVEDL